MDQTNKDYDKPSFDQLTDEEIAERLKFSKDRTLHSELYDRYIDKVYFKCLSITNDAALARDFAHDIFIKIFTNLHQFKGNAILSLWIVTASETLGWDVLSQEVSKLINWLPSLFTALVFFLIGIYLANFVRDLIKGATSSLGIQGGSVLSAVVFYLLIIMISLSALQQAGMDTSILSSNLLLIIAGVLLAGALSYGLASRDILANLLASVYGKRTLKKGQVIAYDNLEGTIMEINSINVVLKSREGQRVVIPSNELINNRFTILKEAPGAKD